MATLDLHQAAAMQRGETVAGFGLDDLLHAGGAGRRSTQADLEQIAARKEEMGDRIPGIADGEWSE